MSLPVQQPGSRTAAVSPHPKYAPDAMVPDDLLDARRVSDRLRREQRLDDELAQSFPASDPPGWVLGTSPTPR